MGPGGREALIIHTIWSVGSVTLVHIGIVGAWEKIIILKVDVQIFGLNMC